MSNALLVSIREIVGAVGDVSGVTGDDGAEGKPMPTELIAYTRKKYAVPFVSPVTAVARRAEAPSSNSVQTDASSEYSMK